MKLKIEALGVEYTLELDRNLAKELSMKLSDAKDDQFATIDLMIDSCLYKNHSYLTVEEKKAIIEDIEENYSLIDTEEKGLVTLIADMIAGAIPKGFTGKTAKKVTIVE